jgi:hypothetical protein
MKTKIAYAMKISKENDKAFKIKLIPSNSKSDQILFEFISEKIPNIETVIKLYYFSISNKSVIKSNHAKSNANLSYVKKTNKNIFYGNADTFC